MLARGKIAAVAGDLLDQTFGVVQQPVLGRDDGQVTQRVGAAEMIFDLIGQSRRVSVSLLCLGRAAGPVKCRTVHAVRRQADARIAEIKVDRLVRQAQTRLDVADLESGYRA